MRACVCEGHRQSTEDLSLFYRQFPGEGFIPCGSIPRFVYNIEVTPSIIPAGWEETEIQWNGQKFRFKGFCLLSFYQVSVFSLRVVQSQREIEISLVSQDTQVLTGRPLTGKDVMRMEWLHEYLWTDLLAFDWLRPTFTNFPTHQHGSKRFLFFPRFIGNDDGVGKKEFF